MPKDRAAAEHGRLQAWDLPTRLFHWSLVVCIVSSWVSFRYAESLGDPTMKWHRYNGYAILILIVFRLIWGFVGSPTSRWLNFLSSPFAAFRYGKALLSGQETPHYLGHNPAGSYVILGLLTVVVVQACTGLFVVEHNDTTWGPLYKLVSESSQKLILYVHGNLFFVVLLPLIAAHIAANILYSLIKKDHLIKAMVVGHKPAQQYVDHHPAPRNFKPLPTAIVTLIVSALIVLGGIAMLGGKLFY